MSRRLHVLLIDDSRRALSSAFRALLAPHDVEIAVDALDAIHRIDCAVRPHDIIFCDLVRGRGELSGALLWGYLKIGRPFAARRMVLVASTPVDSTNEELLGKVGAPCIYLPNDQATLDSLVASFTNGYSPPLLRLNFDADSPMGKAS